MTVSGPSCGRVWTLTVIVGSFVAELEGFGLAPTQAQLPSGMGILVQ